MNDQNNLWEQNLVLALALAGRLEEAGQYNLAKLMRAAADSQARKAVQQFDLPGEKSTLAGEVMNFVGALSSMDVNPDLISAIQKGAMRMAEGKLPLIEETPDPYVCRTCGHLTMRKQKESCPSCGASGTTFQRFHPVYWLEALDPYTALEKLRQTPIEIAMLLEGADEELLNLPPEDGGWTIRNILSHVLDAQGVLNFRVILMLTQENPVLKSLAVFDWATNDEDRPATAAEILAIYRKSRQETISRLGAIPLADWWRTARHHEFGSVTVRQQASYFAMHEITHLPTITRLLARARDRIQE